MADFGRFCDYHFLYLCREAHAFLKKLTLNFVCCFMLICSLGLLAGELVTAKWQSICCPLSLFVAEVVQLNSVLILCMCV